MNDHSLFVKLATRMFSKLPKFVTSRDDRCRK
jgi:hypothetical protein